MPRINAEYREDAKKKIFNAALDVAAEQGWTSVTLEAIAQKVGVTKGAFYSYFPNSNSLMQEVMLFMIRKLRNHVVDDLTGEDDIHAALDRIAAFFFLQPKPFIPVFIQAISTMPKDAVFQEKISALFDENSHLIITALTRYQERGRIPREVDLTHAARALYGLTMGLGIMTHVVGKDPKACRDTWIMGVGRILMLEPRNRK
ncbi:MAG: TetR/AcrR family transcriptional regulator [Methanomicrobiales archaeon]|nr:TetR/AcrR family transcriptional regulator [Methanomicrobiales archaeon]